MNSPASQVKSIEFNVFLSHNSEDKDSVRNIKHSLDLLNIVSWVDEEQMPPGTPFQTALEEGLKQSKTIAIFIGEKGKGKWHDIEIQSAINLSVNLNKRVIPVLLPGNYDKSELPVFLQNYSFADFRKGLDNPIELKRLAWAITGQRSILTDSPSISTPVSDESEAAAISELNPSIESPVQSALDYLEQVLDSVNISYFIGQGINYSGIGSVISPQKISRELMAALQLIDNGYSQLLPSIDTSSSYFALGKTDTLLEKAIAKHIREAPDNVIPTYQQLAELLALSNKRGPRRGQYINTQMVVTSNFDLILERCLLRAGLSFTRLVQYRASPRIDQNEYKNVSVLPNNLVSIDGPDGSAQKADLKDTGDLDNLITHCNKKTYPSASSLSLSNLATPIIYKINGSYDLPNSCLMTIDQHFDFIWRQSKQTLIPDPIKEIIKNSPLLFIGTRILDPDFRLGYHVLLREEPDNPTYQRYALLARVNDGDLSDCAYRLLNKCWEPIKKEAISRYKIEMIDISNEKFLELLRQKFAQLVGA